MKKIIVILLGILVGFCWLADIQAEEVSTSISLKNDWVSPEGGKTYLKQGLSTYWNYEWLGGGLDMTVKPEFDYFAIWPYLTLNQAPFYLLGGVSTDSCGADYVYPGIWYVDTFGETNFFLGLKNYWSIGGEASASDYLNSFLKITYPVSEKFFAGIDLEYIRWWEDSNNWYFIGPFIGRKITKAVSLIIRPSRSWDESTKEDMVRLEMAISF